MSAYFLGVAHFLPDLIVAPIYLESIFILWTSIEYI